MDFSDYFKGRRTVRRYSDKAVPAQLLRDMLDAAMQAPTTGGMQVYSAVVTTRADLKKALAPCHFNQPQVEQSAAVITFCADFNRFVKWCEMSDAVPGYDNFQSFMTAVLDAVIFAQQFNTIAEMNGLGCCYLGTTTYNAEEISRVLDLPKRVVPIVTLTVGYPADDSVMTERIPVESVVHWETYKDYSSDDIHAAYAAKEALPINRRYVEENGKSSLAQVFTDVRYTREANEVFSAKFYDFIAKAGFNWNK